MFDFLKDKALDMAVEQGKKMLENKSPKEVLNLILNLLEGKTGNEMLDKIPSDMKIKILEKVRDLL